MIDCPNCTHQFKKHSFVYHKIQTCPECQSRVVINFPYGSGFVPIILALLPSLYVYSAGQGILVVISCMILFYWLFDIIMNNIFIHMGYYEIELMD